MIPSGYINFVYGWATRPDLSDDERAARKTQLLDLHDSLATGELTAKPTRALTSGTLNGKTFTWAPSLTTDEKAVVLTAVLARLGLLDPSAIPSTVTYGDFTCIAR